MHSDYGSLPLVPLGLPLYGRRFITPERAPSLFAPLSSMRFLSLLDFPVSFCCPDLACFSSLLFLFPRNSTRACGEGRPHAGTYANNIRGLPQKPVASRRLWHHSLIAPKCLFGAGSKTRRSFFHLVFFLRGGEYYNRCDLTGPHQRLRTVRVESAHDTRPWFGKRNNDLRKSGTEMGCV